LSRSPETHSVVRLDGSIPSTRRRATVSIMLGSIIGFVTWFLMRYLVAGLYTVNQNERAVKTSFGRAQRVGQATTLGDPISEGLNDEEMTRTCGKA